MKGLGRNVKLLMGKWNAEQIVIYGMFFLIYIFMAIWNIETFPQILEGLPVFLMGIMVIVVLIILAMGEVDCISMVFFGSSRKPAALGILLTQHIFLLEQLILLYVVVALAEKSEFVKVVRMLPLVIIAIVLCYAGMIHFIHALSLSGHKVCAGILAFATVLVPVILLLYVEVVFQVEMSVELISPFNNIWVLLAGLAVDLIGAVVYLKTVMKADLKLA